MKKQCCHCKKYKELNRFYKSKIHRMGVGALCKECIREIDRPRLSKRKKNKYHHNTQNAFRSFIKWHGIKRGSCVICGLENAYGHHRDYEKRFTVVWLCPEHHDHLHKGLLNIDVNEYAISYK